MKLPEPTSSDITLTLVEAGLTLIIVGLAFCWPRVGHSLFSKLEYQFKRLALQRRLAVISVGVSALLLRLAIIPFCPIPLPFVPDDFSFLLAADTFLHGRLTNPTPLMWKHFETIHVTMLPTYMSMYFPAQGLILAASRLLFGHPWYGILITSALMCAAICWMLQAWIPATWALLGGIVAILHIGLFSYWIDTYHAGGLITGLGGALVLGALPRLMRKTRQRDALLMAIGIILLATTRPFEGLLLCLPVAFVLGRWLLFGSNRPSNAILLRRAVLPLCLLIAAGSWMAYYDYRAFGKATTLPYTVDRETYAIVPYFIWQKVRPEPNYRYAEMREFYTVGEYKSYKKLHSLTGFIPWTLVKVGTNLAFYTGFALLVPLIMIRRVFLDRRLRFLIVATLILAGGMLMQIYLIPHYLAPFTCVFYAIGLQAMRHLRLWKPGGKIVGAALVRLTIALCVVMVGLRLAAKPLHFYLPPWPASTWNCSWYGPGHFGTEREQMEKTLASMPGDQLVIVRYAADHNAFDEWVYNEADIDHSKVIWAREMDPINNSELFHLLQGKTRVADSA